jgi:hypothetical protein
VGMDEELFKKLTDSENYISGIYNYCDRWCERCSYTDKCLSYHMSKHTYDGKDVITDKKFWSDLENSFKLVKDMLNNYMMEHNIPFPDESENDMIGFEMKKVQNLVKADPILLEAQNYTMFSSELLRDNNNFSSLENLLKSNEQYETNIIALHEAVEVILYYKSLIFVKISRALYSYYMNDEHEFKDYEEDKLISAKIALLAVERSMASWHFIFEKLNHSIDSIIDILLLLNNLKRKIEKLIPTVINYKRPYFD